MYFVKHLGWASITHSGRGLSCGAGQGRFLTKTSLWSDVYQNQACDRQDFQIILPGLLLFHAPGEEILHACILIRARFEFFSLYLPPHHRRTVRVVHIHSCFMSLQTIQYQYAKHVAAVAAAVRVCLSYSASLSVAFLVMWNAIMQAIHIAGHSPVPLVAWTQHPYQAFHAQCVLL
jgi:hypothetical protein